MNIVATRKADPRRVVIMAAMGCVLALAGCREGRTVYGAIRDAQAARDGSALYVVVESGERSGGRPAVERATSVTLYRFDGETGTLTTVRSQKPGDDRAARTVAELGPGLSTRPLTRCTALFGECSETAAVDAFVAGDAVAVPRSRALLVVQYGRLSRVPMPLGGPDEFRIAADARARRILASLKAEADAALRTMRAKDDGAPREVEAHRSSTLFGEVPPIVASYVLVPGATTIAAFDTGTLRSLVAWDAKGRCTTDDPRIVRALPTCTRAEIDLRGAALPMNP